jgi:hypothetical protein
MSVAVASLFDPDLELGISTRRFARHAKAREILGRRAKNALARL